MECRRRIVEEQAQGIPVGRYGLSADRTLLAQMIQKEALGIGNVGGICSAMTNLPESEILEAVACGGHQIRDAGQIPICVRYLCMPDVGRECRDRVVDIGTIGLPPLDASADECVSEVMDANVVMGTPGNDAGFVAQLLEGDDTAPASALNDCWSMDFLSDQLFDGRKIRVLSIIDNFSRVSAGARCANELPRCRCRPESGAGRADLWSPDTYSSG